MSSRRGGKGRRKGRQGKQSKGKNKNKGKKSGSNSANSSFSNLDSISNNSNAKQNNNKPSKPQEEPQIFVGLDIGSTSIKIAVAQATADSELNTLEKLSSLFLNQDNNSSAFHSKINLLADDTGQRCIPSVITILDSDHNEYLIGSEAVKSSIRNYKNAIYFSKHLISLTQLNDSKNENKSSLNIDEFQSNFSKFCSMQLSFFQHFFQILCRWKKSASKFGMNKVVMRPIFDDDNDDNEESDSKMSKSKEKSLPFLKLKYRIKQTDGDEFIENYIDNGFILMLKKIFKVISSQTGSTKLNVVSCVPYYYTTQQIMYYKSLLLQSGFNPLQIVYDHTASIMSLHCDNDQNIKSVLCIDFGTFYSTFCVIQLCNGLIVSSKESNYYYKNDQICGVALDECILKWLIKDFQNRNRGCYVEPENAKCRLKLCKEISRIKSVLSSGSAQVRVDIESLYDGIDYHFNLSRAKFESIIYDEVNGINNWMNEQIKVCAKSFDKVIVSGGLAEIPKVKERLYGLFGDKLGTKELNSKGIAANFVNVYGCAIEAASLSYLYNLQSQIQSGPQSLQKIVNINKQRQNLTSYKEKNGWLNKFSHNRMLFNSKRINLYVLIGDKEKKSLCCIERMCPLPFENECAIEDGNVLKNEMDEIVFGINVMADDDEKSVLDNMELAMNANNALQSKKKKKSLTVSVSMDENNEISVCMGKEKIVFEFDDEDDNDNESGDDEEDNGTIDTKTNDNDNDTIDID